MHTTLETKDIIFTLIVCKKTGGKSLQMKHIFFTFNLNSTQIDKCRNFTDKGHLFYINDLQTNSGQILQMKDILFTFNLHGMQKKQVVKL